MVLYHDDPEALERLLRQALGKFQDKAGMIAEISTMEAVMPTPEHFRATATCRDSKRRYIPHRVHTDGEMRLIEFLTEAKHQPPYLLSYFLDLRNWPLDEDLPGDCEALLGDYLEALIAVQNTERNRLALLVEGVDTADLPTVQDLRARLTELEQVMEDNKAFIFPASSF